jgi:hypothetical protein
MESRLPLWLDYARSIGPLLAVLVAVGVALMQFYLQRRQLEQSLFDKRFAVYSAVRRFLMECSQASLGILKDDPAYRLFQRDTPPAKFLFGDDVSDLLAQVHKHVTYSEGEQGSITMFDSEATALSLAWEAEKVFYPYLAIYKDRNVVLRAIDRADQWMANGQSKFAGRYRGDTDS